jgi:hypothetical protein
MLNVLAIFLFLFQLFDDYIFLVRLKITTSLRCVVFSLPKVGRGGGGLLLWVLISQSTAVLLLLLMMMDFVFVIEYYTWSPDIIWQNCYLSLFFSPTEKPCGFFHHKSSVILF